MAEDLSRPAAGVWGVAAVTACAELGNLDSLVEGREVDADVSPALAERLLGVLVVVGLAQRTEDGYVATPELASRSPGFLAADGASGVLQAAELVRRAFDGRLAEGGWRHADPLVLQAQGTMSAAAVPQLEGSLPRRC